MVLFSTSYSCRCNLRIAIVEKDGYFHVVLDKNNRQIASYSCRCDLCIAIVQEDRYFMSSWAKITVKLRPILAGEICASRSLKKMDIFMWSWVK